MGCDPERDDTCKLTQDSDFASINRLLGPPEGNGGSMLTHECWMAVSISMLSISDVVAMAELTRHPDSESAGAMLAQASGGDEQARWNRRQV